MSNKKVKKSAIAVFVIGVVALIAGAAFLVVRLVNQPSVADADFLVEMSEWVRADEPTVVWKFTEVGKGTLTTDGHQNDYDFTWEIEDNKLAIETKWLYELDNSFDYVLDQGSKTLTLTNPETGKEVTLKAL